MLKIYHHKLIGTLNKEFHKFYAYSLHLSDMKDVSKNK